MDDHTAVMNAYMRIYADGLRMPAGFWLNGNGSRKGLKMSYNQTMTDVAYNYLAARKMEVEFLTLWNEVAEEMKIPQEKLRRKTGQFYSELMMDKRFASLENNKWDLRNRRKFAEVYINTSEIELEDEEEQEELPEENELDLSSAEETY